MELNLLPLSIGLILTSAFGCYSILNKFFLMDFKQNSIDGRIIIKIICIFFTILWTILVIMFLNHWK